MLSPSLSLLILMALSLQPPTGAPAAPPWGEARQVQQAWDGDSLVEGTDLSDQVVILREGHPDTFIKAPSGSSGVTHRNGHSVSLRLFDGKFLLSTRDMDTGWRDHDTSLNQPGEPGGLQGVPISLHATTKADRFFATNFTLGFRQDGKASALSWWRLTPAGVLRPESILPLDWDGPVFLAAPEQAMGPCMNLAPRHGNLVPFLEFPIRVPGSFVVVSLGSGILWTITEENQKIHKVFQLGSSLAAGSASRREGGRLIHAIQPTREGKLLAALRGSESFDVEGVASEEILWREIDPMEGTVREPSPEILEGLPRTIPSGGTMTFRFDPTGRVKASTHQ